MTKAARIGVRVGLGAALAVAAAAAPWSIAPAGARACDELTASATRNAGLTEVLLSLPARLTGSTLGPAQVSVTQNGLDLPVLTVAAMPPEQTDVVVVVDTSAAAAARAADVRGAADALLTHLAPGTSAAVVSTSDNPLLVRELLRDPSQAVPAVDALPNGGRNALVDGLLAGVQQLPGDPARQQQVVVVAASPDGSGGRSWPTAASMLAHRGIALDVIDLSPSGPSLPAAGAQCPGRVEAGAGAAAATTLAGQIEDRRRLMLPLVQGTAPMRVTVTDGQTSVSAPVQRRNVAPGPVDAARQPRRHDSGVGAGTLLLAFVVGMVGLAILLVALIGQSSRGRSARRAAGQLVGALVVPMRERHTPDDARRMPRAEATRRRADAWQDLGAALGSGPTARQRAEKEARDEAVVRAVAEDHLAAVRERVEAHARAAERYRRARERAEWLAAEERAARESERLYPRGSVPPLRDRAVAGDEASLALLAEAERVLAAQREAAAAAVERRREAERLADEAVERAERERAAAKAAQEAREAAERAAAEAEASAERERRTAGRASEERLAAEQAARAAAAEVAAERRAAEEALARRRAADAKAADAEQAQNLAVHHEVAAIEAAEVAEAGHRAVVAKLAASRPSTIALPVTDAPSRRITAAVGPAVDGGQRPAAPQPPPRPRREQPAGPPAEPPAAPPSALAVRSAPPARDPGNPAAAVEPTPAEAIASPDGEPTIAVPVLRILAILLVPLVMAVRTMASGAWWADAGGVGALLGCVLVLTVLGVRWVWVATSTPHALLRRNARQILAAREQQRRQGGEAAELLRAIRDGSGTDESWARFESGTGLVVPAATRLALDPDMDPTAFVHLLTGSRPEGLVHPQSLATVVVVPLLICLVPAALIVLAL